MNEAKFTKGPWNFWQVGGVSSDIYSIEGVGKFNVPNRENRALIAAAPETYKELEKTQELLSDYHEFRCGEPEGLTRCICGIAAQWRVNENILTKARGEA